MLDGCCLLSPKISVNLFEDVEIQLIIQWHLTWLISIPRMNL